MKHYKEESKELTKPLSDFFSAAMQCQIVEKSISEAKINDLTHADLNLKFCTKENMDFNPDEDGCILYWKASDLKTQFVMMQDLLSRLNEYNKLPEKYFCHPLPSMNFYEQPILMIPKAKLHSQTNQLRFFAKNICFSFKENIGTFNDLLKNKRATLDSVFTYMGELAQVAMEIKTPFISQDDFLPVMKQHIVRLFNGAKEMAFVSLVEKARHILFNILMEKNKNSPNPDQALEERFKKDKNEIYKRAERKGLIKSAWPLMEFQKIRDELRHPSTLGDLMLPDSNYIVDAFDDMRTRLSGKEIHLMLGDETTTLPRGWKKVDQIDFLTAKEIDSMCQANHCIKTVDTTNRLAEEIIAKQADAKQKIQRKKQIQRLVSMGVITPDQKQNLENAILQRNNVSHGHASGQEISNLCDRTSDMTDLFNRLLVKARI